LGSLYRPKEYLRPKNINEAISLLDKYGEKAKILAGGTDFLVVKPPEIEYLIDITNLDLNYIKRNENGLKIGATTTLNEIKNSEILENSPYSVLVKTACNHSDPSIRNMATIGGNISHAVPSADMAPPLMALDASARIVSTNGERIVAIEDYFLGPKVCCLGSNELLVEIQVPNQPDNTKVAFNKIGRTSRDLALVNAAVRVTLDDEGTCKDVRIILGAVAPTPLRCKQAEAILRGKKVDDLNIEKTAQKASEEAKPINDIRASAEYRRAICRVLVKRALKECIEKLRR
jgi:carbon-monoxide dehydrogenase medium subunit